MSVDAHFNRIVSRVASVFGSDTASESATYTPQSGDSVSGLSVVLDKEAALEMVISGDEFDSEAVVIFVAVSALASPAEGGRFTIGSDSWNIHAKPVSLGGIWTCLCRRVTVATRNKQRVEHG